MTKKFYLLFVLIIISIGLLLHKKCNGKSDERISIAYDKIYVEKLLNFEGYKDLSFEAVGETKNPSAIFFDCWEDEPGDFRRVRIKLKSGNTIEYDYVDGWDKFDNQSTVPLLPNESTKVEKNDLGVTLDIGQGNCILALFGHLYASDPAGFLTLIYIGKDTAKIIFNKQFKLFEIREQKQNYSLIGRIGNIGTGFDPYEIAIKDGKLTLAKLPLQKVYEGQAPHIILYNSIGWNYDKQPGEFTRLEITAPPKSKEQENQVFNVAYYEDTWTPFAVPVKLPAHTTTIKQTPYFIMLENAVGRTIILSRRSDKENKSAGLTILRSAPHYPTSLFNHYFHLQEITEDDTAYHLLGTRKDAEDPAKVYKITINKANMSEVECNW